MYLAARKYNAPNELLSPSLTVDESGLEELGDVECDGDGGHGHEVLDHAVPERAAVVGRLAVVDWVLHRHEPAIKHRTN